MPAVTSDDTNFIKESKFVVIFTELNTNNVIHSVFYKEEPSELDLDELRTEVQSPEFSFLPETFNVFILSGEDFKSFQKMALTDIVLANTETVH